MLAVMAVVLEPRTQLVQTTQAEDLLVWALAKRHYPKHLIEALEELEASLVVVEGWRAETVLQIPREAAEGWDGQVWPLH